MLYANSDQLDLRHVVSLADYEVDVYGGGEAIPEGELFIRRHCIRLLPRPRLAETTTAESIEDTAKKSRFFLFSNDCSFKEDFYLALMQSQSQHSDPLHDLPRAVPLQQPHMVKLMQQLHLSEKHSSMRWLNALIGRIFLATYNAKDLEHAIRAKLVRKLAGAPRPSFLSQIDVTHVDLGHAAPVLTEPSLKEFSLHGSTTVQVNIHYAGSLKLMVKTSARIELGTRLKPRTVELALAGIVQRLEGRLLIRIKPPPSNRIWISFEEMPLLELKVQPLVSSWQMSYGVVIRAIESRIRQIVAESVVLPFWDDIPFLDTDGQRFRGGIWEAPDEAATKPSAQEELHPAGDVYKPVGAFPSKAKDPPTPAKITRKPVATQSQESSSVYGDTGSDSSSLMTHETSQPQSLITLYDGEAEQKPNMTASTPIRQIPSSLASSPAALTPGSSTSQRRPCSRDEEKASIQDGSPSTASPRLSSSPSHLAEL